MSSREFSVTLTADRRTRRHVLLIAALLAAISVLLIAHMRLPLLLRVMLSIAYIAFCTREVLLLSRGAGALRRVRLTSAGDVWIEDPRGRETRAILLPGTLILQRAAWLRFRLANGRKYGELFVRGRVKEGDWHRLQLLMQQCRQRFSGARTD